MTRIVWCSFCVLIMLLLSIFAMDYAVDNFPLLGGMPLLFCIVPIGIFMLWCATVWLKR